MLLLEELRASLAQAQEEESRKSAARLGSVSVTVLSVQRRSTLHRVQLAVSYTPEQARLGLWN